MTFYCRYAKTTNGTIILYHYVTINFQNYHSFIAGRPVISYYFVSNYMDLERDAIPVRLR